MKKEKSSMEDLEQRAEHFIELGKLERAEAVLKKMLQLDKNSLPAHFNLVRVYIRSKQSALAIEHAKKTLRLNPKEKNAHLNLGIAYDLAGRESLAIRHLKRELACNAASVETLWNLGDIFFRRKDWKTASYYWQQSLDLGYAFNLAETVFHLGICHQKLGRNLAYIKLYSRFLEDFPGEAWAWANYGRALLYYSEDPKAALHAFARAIDLGLNADLSKEITLAKRRLVKKGRGTKQGQSRRN